VEASTNVFVEDLHSARTLETTSYITDSTQASDFSWLRESGLRVNVGILNVNLIPEYRAVNHDSDNKYMLSYPNESEEKASFQRVVDSFCKLVFSNVVIMFPALYFVCIYKISFQEYCG